LHGLWFFSATETVGLRRIRLCLRRGNGMHLVVMIRIPFNGENRVNPLSTSYYGMLPDALFMLYNKHRLLLSEQHKSDVLRPLRKQFKSVFTELYWGGMRSLIDTVW